MHKEELVAQLVENKKRHVYFIQIGDNGPIKIGITKKIRHRLATIQVDNPCLIYLLAVFPGDRNEELSLHKKFSDFNIIGEWFEPCQELLDFIKQYPELNLQASDFRIKRKTGDKCSYWKGECACDSSKQQRARSRKKNKTSYCERCKTGRALDIFYKDGNKNNLCNDNIGYYCRRCRMEMDGTLEGMKYYKHEKLPPRPCKICERLVNGLSHGRCHACMEFFRRNGFERSEKKIGPKDPVSCIVCGKLVQQPAKGKCHTCYEFFRKNGFERFDGIIKDIETEDIIKLKTFNVLMDLEKATFIRKIYKTKLYSVGFIAKHANISKSYCYDIIRNVCIKDEDYIYIKNTCSNKIVLNDQSETDCETEILEESVSVEVEDPLD